MNKEQTNQLSKSAYNQSFIDSLYNSFENL